jgi:hypothetical protein
MNPRWIALNIAMAWLVIGLLIQGPAKFVAFIAAAAAAYSALD